MKDGLVRITDTERHAVVAVAVILFLGQRAGAGDVPRSTLRRRLNEIYASRTGAEGDMERIEAATLRLLEGPRLPEQRGMIFASLVRAYANSKEKQPAKMAHYCMEALKHPLDLVGKLRMYSYWVDAIIMLAGEVRDPEEFATLRRRAMSPCLDGLRLVLENQSAGNYGPLPAVSRFHYIGSTSDPGYQEMRKRHEKQMAARKKAELQNELVFREWVFVRQCAVLYAREPRATEELQRLARDKLGDEGAVEELVEAARLVREGKILRRPKSDDRERGGRLKTPEEPKPAQSVPIELEPVPAGRVDVEPRMREAVAFLLPTWTLVALSACGVALLGVGVWLLWKRES